MKRTILTALSLALIYGVLCYVAAGFIAAAADLMPNDYSQSWKSPGDGWIYAALALALGTAGLLALGHSARKH